MSEKGKRQQMNYDQKVLSEMREREWIHRGKISEPGEYKRRTASNGKNDFRSR